MKATSITVIKLLDDLHKEIMQEELLLRKLVKVLKELRKKEAKK